MKEKKEQKERIELHCESSYSYKNFGSVVTPRELLEECEVRQVSAIGIVDYCNCAAIPKFEKLKKELKIDNLKIIYGISLNIKYGDLYVPSIILAKNSKGLKNLYHIVTKLNNDDCYFILQKDLDLYKDDFILGINTFDLDKSYDNIINYYSYVEITPNHNKEDVNKINNYCKKHNLLLIATSKPTRIMPNDIKLNNILKELYDTFARSNETSYYMSTSEMLNYFNYLDNAEDIVIENQYKIIEMIDDYHLDFDKKYMIEVEDKDVLRKSVFEKANLIYLEDVPEYVRERLNYELNLINKYNLEGTILTIKKLVDKAKELDGYAAVGSYFSHSLIAYLEGLIEINPMDLNKQVDILNMFEKYGFTFELFISPKVYPLLVNYLKDILKTNTLYQKSRIWGVGDSKLLTDYFKQTNIKEYEEINLISIFKEVKTKQGIIPDTYYLIPNNIKITDLTPINYGIVDKNIETLEFSNTLKHSFVSLRFRPTDTENRLYLLEQKTNISRDDISLNDEKVLKNSYIKVKNNTVEAYKSYIHFNIANYWAPEMPLCLEANEKEPKDIYEFIELRNEIDTCWLSRVMHYYFDSYYRTYYPKEYYEIYLDSLIERNNFNRKVDVIEFIKSVVSYYEDNKIEKIIKEENDAITELIIKTICKIKEKELDIVIDNIVKKYDK